MRAPNVPVVSALALAVVTLSVSAGGSYKESENCLQSGIITLDSIRTDPKTGAMEPVKVSLEFSEGGIISFTNINVTCNDCGYDKNKSNECPKEGTYTTSVSRLDSTTGKSKPANMTTKIDYNGTLDRKYGIKCDGAPETCNGVCPPATLTYPAQHTDPSTGAKKSVTITLEICANSEVKPQHKITCAK